MRIWRSGTSRLVAISQGRRRDAQGATSARAMSNPCWRRRSGSTRPMSSDAPTCSLRLDKAPPPTRAAAAKAAWTRCGKPTKIQRHIATPHTERRLARLRTLELSPAQTRQLCLTCSRRHRANHSRRRSEPRPPRHSTTIKPRAAAIATHAVSLHDAESDRHERMDERHAYTTGILPVLFSFNGERVYTYTKGSRANNLTTRHMQKTSHPCMIRHKINEFSKTLVP